MIRLALMRHGHTDWNRAGRIQGRTDIPLDNDAVAHLRSLQLPAEWQNADAVASPLKRAMLTAQLVTDRTPTAEPNLVEMDWGEWEGKHGRDLLAQGDSGYRHIEEWGWDYRPPGGESPRDVLNRILPWANSLSKDTIAVCHIGIMRVLMAHASGWAFSGPAPFRIKRDRLFILTGDDNNWTLEDTAQRLESRLP